MIKTLRRVIWWLHLKTRRPFPGGYLLECSCGYTRRVLYTWEDFKCPVCSSELHLLTDKQSLEKKTYRIAYYLFTTEYADNTIPGGLNFK